VTAADLGRSVAIMRERLERLGISDPEVHTQGAGVIVIELPDVRDRGTAAVLIGKTALLEFYDFEAALAGPSVTGLAPIPVAFPSLYRLLAAPQTRVLAKKGASQWYLFNAAKAVAKGPAPTKSSLGTAPKGWTILAAPKNTVVVSCDVAAGNCLSSRQITTKKGFYLFRHSDDPSDPVPQMTGRDLELSGTRADIDPQTNQPAVLIQFTERGKAVFHEITRREAQRGALVCQGQRDREAVVRCAQHFAIVLDREIQTLPYIDFVANPDGIPGDNGVQIELGAGGSLEEAKRLALVLQTGALPLQFVQLP
jgi:preprotein translocase subunit SecD